MFELFSVPPNVIIDLMTDNYVPISLITEELVGDRSIEAISVQFHLSYTKAGSELWRPLCHERWGG
jgi:hypothetical protein